MEENNINPINNICETITQMVYNGLISSSIPSSDLCQIHDAIERGKRLIDYHSECMSKINITYGANETFIDITDIVLKKCIQLLKIVHNNKSDKKWCIYIPIGYLYRDKQFGDPLPGIHKVIRIKINDTIVTYYEHQSIVWILSLDDDRASCIVTEHTRFEYGANNTFIDITDLVQSRCIDNIEISYQSENERKSCIYINNRDREALFGDPLEGVHKTIRVINDSTVFDYTDDESVYLISTLTHTIKNIELEPNDTVTDFYDENYRILNRMRIAYEPSSYRAIYKEYSNEHYIEEKDVLYTNSITGIGYIPSIINASIVDHINNFILVIDFRNRGGGTTFFINTVVSYYKSSNIFIIARNYDGRIHFLINDQYELSHRYDENGAIEFLQLHKAKIQKIIINHALNHTPYFITRLFELEKEFTIMTHDFYSLIVEPNAYVHQLGHIRRSDIDINRYHTIVTQHIGNLHYFKPYITSDKNIIISSLPDYHYPQDCIQVKHNQIVIGIIGCLSDIKGSHIIQQIIDRYKGDSRIRFVIFGGSHEYKHLSHMMYPYKNIRELNQLLEKHQPTLLLETSICHETYSYTLSLAMITNLPILYLKKTGYSTVEQRLSSYKKAYPFSTMNTFNQLIWKCNQNYFYTIRPTIYFNLFWNELFLPSIEKRGEHGTILSQIAHMIR